jgi:hypothetical protein
MNKQPADLILHNDKIATQDDSSELSRFPAAAVSGRNGIAFTPGNCLAAPRCLARRTVKLPGNHVVENADGHRRHHRRQAGFGRAGPACQRPCEAGKSSGQTIGRPVNPRERNLDDGLAYVGVYHARDAGFFRHIPSQALKRGSGRGESGFFPGSIGP